MSHHPSHPVPGSRDRPKPPVERVGILAVTMLFPLALGGFLLAPSREALGAVVVGVVAVANYWLLVWLVRALASEAGTALLGLLLLKIGLLVVAASLIVRGFGLGGLPTLVGGAVIPVAVVLAASLGWLADLEDGGADAPAVEE